jgi:hypothetical protein
VAKNKTKTPDITEFARFKTPEMAALYGLDTKATGKVVFNHNGIVTVDFGTAKAIRVSDSIFDFTQAVDPATIEAQASIEAPDLIEALKDKWEVEDEAE